jgi:excisionase family DNA binding protein
LEGLNLSKFLTIVEASKVLNMTPEALSRMCADGRIPALKIGGRWRVSLDEIVKSQHNQKEKK